MTWSDWQGGFVWTVPVDPTVVFESDVFSVTYGFPTQPAQAAWDSTAMPVLRTGPPDPAGVVSARNGVDSAFFDTFFGFRAIRSDGDFGANNVDLYMLLGEIGVTLTGAAVVDAPAAVVPPDLPPDAVPIPSGEGGSWTYSDIVDYEAGTTTFLGWNDAVLADRGASILGYDTGSSWTPPSTIPCRWGYTDPVTYTDTGFTDGAPLAYPTDHLFSADVTEFGTTDVPAVAVTGPYVPFSEPDVFALTTEQSASVDVTLPLSAVAQPDLSLFLMPGFAFDDTYTIPVITDGEQASINFRLHAADPLSRFFTGFSAELRVLTPRWRYWTDSPLRTIGDHFRSVGGGQIKSLVAGEWVPVRRGT